MTVGAGWTSVAGPILRSCTHAVQTPVNKPHDVLVQSLHVDCGVAID